MLGIRQFIVIASKGSSSSSSSFLATTISCLIILSLLGWSAKKTEGHIHLADWTFSVVAIEKKKARERDRQTDWQTETDRFFFYLTGSHGCSWHQCVECSSLHGFHAEGIPVFDCSWLAGMNDWLERKWVHHKRMWLRPKGHSVGCHPQEPGRAIQTERSGNVVKVNYHREMCDSSREDSLLGILRTVSREGHS